MSYVRYLDRATAARVLAVVDEAALGGGRRLRVRRHGLGRHTATPTPTTSMSAIVTIAGEYRIKITPLMDTFDGRQVGDDTVDLRTNRVEGRVTDV